MVFMFIDIATLPDIPEWEDRNNTKPFRLEILPTTQVLDANKKKMESDSENFRTIPEIETLDTKQKLIISPDASVSICRKPFFRKPRLFNQVKKI